MVGRPAGFLFGIVAVATASVMAGASGARARGSERGADLGSRFAILSNAKIKVGQAAAVDGSIHSNDGVELRKESTVDGDVSAVKDVKNQGGSVLGRVIQHASAVALPATPDKNEARAQANRTLTGPLELIDPVIDDVLFVTGAVAIEGEARGSGTLIATGAITVTPSGAPPPGSSDAVTGRRLTVLTYADLTLSARSALRATARAKGRAMLGEQATFEGSLVADREVELARGARARFAPPADTTAPSLTILGPADPFVTAEPTAAVTVLYADAAPGIDAGSFSLFLDGAAVADRCSIGGGVAACSVGLASSGRHEVVASIRDLDGNDATRSLAFTATLDSQPPAIAIESPAGGAVVADAEVTVRGAVTDDGLVEVVTVDGAPVDAPDGRFARSIPLDEGANLIRVTARDSTGRESEAAISVTLDSEPPQLALHSPAELASPPPGGGVPDPPHLATTLASVVVAGSASDEHGIARVEIAGAPVASADGAFEREVGLEEGANRIKISAADAAGNVGVLELEVDRRTLPTIAIVEPRDGTIVLERAIAVRGTVADPAASVTVNGLAASVAGTSFALEALPLDDGATLINVVATSPSGLESAAGVTVLRDVEAPKVTIHDPAAGSTVYEPAIAVTGMVNDVVVGTVNGAQVAVTVNGIAAQVANRSFLLDRLPLEEGDNTIEVTAVDPSGNVGRDSIVVRLGSPGGATLSVLYGDRQTGVIGEALAMPLDVVLRDGLGAPVPGRVVTFAADGTDGVFADGRRQTAVTTNALGRASVMFTLGRRAGHQTVRATATAVAGAALFVLRALPAEPAVLVVDSGDQQVGSTGQALRAPFAAVVTDDGFNRLEGAVVHFEVVEGGGSLENREQAIDLFTDSDGRVEARLTLGVEEGIGTNVVRATLVDGPPEAQVTFTATALVAGEPAATTVSGVVLDNSDQPVPGATVTLEGTALETRADASGFFRLAGAPPGTTHLRVRGSTVERPGVWPSLEFLITIISGRDNSMGRPIYLPVLDTANALAVDESTGGVLTIANLPGFALEIEPGSVTFPGGRRSGVITVTPVHSDKVPMPPNFGQQPRFVITIQPGGAHFDPPARVTFPNVDGLSPGQVTELYSFDHDLARFVSIGPGIVTGDGTRIVSDRGVGIAKAGWHGGGDPARPGTCHDCGQCKQPSGGACVADDSRVPKQKAPDDCQAEVCFDGRAVSRMTNQETAKQIDGNCYEELCPPQRRAVDLGDAPPGAKCCGDSSKPLPGGVEVGVLTGIYDPATQCCVQDASFIISKKAPIDLARCPKPVPPPTPIEVSYDGCSVPTFVDSVLLIVDPFNPYSGDPDEPTPPASGDALFSRVGSGTGSPAGPCDLHDQCYQTCGSGRTECDSAFATDLNDACAGVTGVLSIPDPLTGSPLERSRMDVCLVWAARYAGAVWLAGTPAHRDGQASHCDCECS